MRVFLFLYAKLGKKLHMYTVYPQIIANFVRFL